MTEDVEMARIDVLAAHKDACRLGVGQMEPGIKAVLLAWCRRAVSRVRRCPPSPRDVDERGRRKAACKVALTEAQRLGERLPVEIAIRMFRWWSLRRADGQA